MRDTNYPRIWLQPSNGDERTWCQDKVYDDDVEYVRADLAPASAVAAPIPALDFFTLDGNMILFESFEDAERVADALQAASKSKNAAPQAAPVGPAPSGCPKENAAVAAPVGLAGLRPIYCKVKDEPMLECRQDVCSCKPSSAAPASSPLLTAFEKIEPLIALAHKSAVNKAVYMPLQEAMEEARKAIAEAKAPASTVAASSAPMPASDFRLMSESEKYGAYASAYRNATAWHQATMTAASTVTASGWAAESINEGPRGPAPSAPVLEALILAQIALRRWIDLYAHLQNDCGEVISRKLDYKLPPAEHVKALEAVAAALEHVKTIPSPSSSIAAASVDEMMDRHSEELSKLKDGAASFDRIVDLVNGQYREMADLARGAPSQQKPFGWYGMMSNGDGTESPRFEVGATPYCLAEMRDAQPLFVASAITRATPECQGCGQRLEYVCTRCIGGAGSGTP